MKIVFSHPTGNANVKAAVNGLFEAELLGQFQTSIASFPGEFIDSLGVIKALSEIRRRRFDPRIKSITQTSPFREAGRLLASKAGLKSLIRHETGIFSIDSVYRNFDKKVALELEDLSKQGADAVYAYEDAASHSFQKAKDLGMKCFYDLPIGYWKTARLLLEDEQKRWPEWGATLTGFHDSETKLRRKDEELLLADKIFVASQFTLKTLQKFPGKLAPIKVIPYGFPPVVDNFQPRKSVNKRLKLLFVGGLSQRKGIANLFAAVDLIGSQVELTVVGHKVTESCVPLNKALEKHTWIPSLPHNEILKIMKEHDVLIFPSLFEGFGLVITEAMSQGTPVITTDRTAGPDLIVHGENGWLVKAGSTEALVVAIEELLSKPEIVAEAGRAAMLTAKNRPWTVYGAELAKAITSTD